MEVIKKIYYVFNKKQKLQCVGIAILIFVGSLFELLGVSAIIPLISVIMSPEIMFTNEICAFAAKIFHIESAGQFVVFLSIGLCFVYVIKNGFLIFSRNVQLSFSYGIEKDISLRLMDYYIHQNYLFHAAHNVADLQRNVSSDVTRFFSAINMIMNLAVEIVTCFVLVVFLFMQDMMTTLMVVGILLVATAVFLFIYKKLQVRYGKITREKGAIQTKWLLQSFAGIKEIKVMNREEFFLKNYRDALQDNNKAAKKAKVLSTMPKNIMETICICSLLLAVCVRISQGIAFEQIAATLSVFAVAAIRMLPSFNRITEYLGGVLYNKVSVDNVYKDLLEADTVERQEKEDRKDVEKLQFNNQIEVRNLAFAYPQSHRKIFEDSAITIQKNKSVAFVGSSGAGKTTLADIIIGVLEPQAGEVLVDGVDIFKNLSAWHKTIGYIPQMIYLMDDTIRANVVFGIKEDEIDDNKVWKALERAEIADFVRGLEDGIHTKIGDRGVRLSGGQRQRIGIARALYEEPDVLILDEATSALDNETEAAVMESIDSLHGKTTLIIIAHRLTTIENCDEVYEVENGRITLKAKKDGDDK